MKVTLKTKRSSAHIDVAAGESILFAGLRQGWALPHECASGTCGTCQAQPIDGDVAELWTHAPGKDHIPEGAARILTCQTTSCSDATLRLFGRLEQQSDGYPRPEYANATLLEFIRINSDVAFFKLALDRDFQFVAGQFAMLRFPNIKGWRAYSMCHIGTNAREIEFLIKHLPNGVVSEHLFESVEIGQSVEVFGPLGRACLNHNHEDKDIVAIAGGSGIAGILAVMQSVLDTEHFISDRVQVFFGLRNPADDFCLDRLSDIVRRSSGQIEVTIVYSERDGVAGDHPKYTNLKIGFGYVHNLAFSKMNSKEMWEEHTCFVAGPPIMVNATEAALQERFGLSPTQIRLDRFG